MRPLSEGDMERLLSHLQQVAEQAPPELRPRRRAIVKGMRCALVAVAAGLPIDTMRAELVAELGVVYKTNPQLEPQSKRTPMAPYADPLPLDAAIIELWNSGLSVRRITEELGCTDMVVDRVRKWCGLAAVGIQPDARQRNVAVASQRRHGH